MNSKLLQFLKPLKPEDLHKALDEYCEEQNLTHEFVEGFENIPHAIRLKNKRSSSKPSTIIQGTINMNTVTYNLAQVHSNPTPLHSVECLGVLEQLGTTIPHLLEQGWSEITVGFSLLPITPEHLTSQHRLPTSQIVVIIK